MRRLDGRSTRRHRGARELFRTDYLDADLTLKERVLDKVAPPSVRARRYRPEDKLMAFLSAL